ncbi:pheromone receptor [Aspergillus glaucus CBS 516.65]|uniref:Uncharacterized protein n=1 Tax=Aspergillus glaucus CBS 516.65 TaxID=1160497 RepID=A0A1L9V8T6_ASPGL|nr:hypothetical protein ASPGLDRAFT_135142 [Aspergillus glaucus CBS 516.65]OJJ80262.1 hypothetical protein ASPGLDRAFT_135142 [Aspergillus glaucus CBS 516.65]
MVYSQAVAIPFLSIIGICIIIVPLILHIKNKNYPSAGILIWFVLLNLFNIINAFIWSSDDTDSWWDGTGLCDFEVKIMIASYVAVPGGLLCVFRSLARVLDTRCATLVPDKKQRWRNRGMEILFCVVVPLLSMATQIFYQKSRYMVYQVSGCINNFDDSPISLALAFIWPPIICLPACWYCGLVLHRLRLYRSQFGDILNASNSNINKSRFIRLFSLNFIMLVIIFPIQCYVVWQNTVLSFPWHTYSWSAVHGPEWNTIVKYTTGGNAFFDRWVPIAACFLVFVFFGCGKDANELYRSFLRSLGLDRCFACLDTEYNRRTSMNSSSGSRVKLLFNKNKRWTSTSRTYVNTNTASTTPTTRQSYHDIEKGMPSIRIDDDQNSHPEEKSWFRSFFHRPAPSKSSNHERHPSHLSLSGQNTVSTNAWAGMSRSRGSDEFSPSPSRRDFIRVRQEISQESVMQEVL